MHAVIRSYLPGIARYPGTTRVYTYVAVHMMGPRARRATGGAGVVIRRSHASESGEL